MRCARSRRMLSLEIDGLLDADRRAALAAHLETCADCRRFREALARARVAIHEVPRPETPPHLAGSTLARHAQTPAAMRTNGAGRAPIARRILAGLPGAAMIALCLGVSALLTRGMVYPARGSLETDAYIAQAAPVNEKGPGREPRATVTGEELRHAVQAAGGELRLIEVEPGTGRLLGLEIAAPARDIRAATRAVAHLTGGAVEIPFLPAERFGSRIRITVRLRP